MKRFLHLALIVGGIGLALVLAAAIALRALLSPDQARALIAHQLETRLGREVKLGDLKIIGLSTFRVSGIQVSEPPSFQAGTFLTADAFQVSARLLPLFFGKLMVKDVVLDHPKLTLVRDADGRFEGVSSSGPTAASTRSPGAKPSDFSIADVRLNAGSVTFVDKSTAALSAVLDPVDVHLAHVSLVAPIALDGSSTVQFRGLKPTMKFQAEFDPVKGDASLTSFAIDVGGAHADVAGRVKNTFGAEPAFNGSLTWSGLNPSSFTAIAALPDALLVRGPTTGRLEVSGTAPSVESRFEADLSAADVRYGGLFSKGPAVPFTVKMALDRNKTGDLSLHDLLLKLASVELTGDGTLKGSNPAARVASFRVETNRFDVADLFRYVHADLPSGVTLSGPVKATLSMEGWTGGGRVVADFDGTGLAATYGDSFRKAPGTKLQLVADGRYATPLAVDFSSVRLDLDQLSMSGRGSYTTGKERPTYVFLVKTNAFPLSSVSALLPVAAPYQPTGQAVVDLRVSRGPDGPLIAGGATLLSAGATLHQAVVSDLAGQLDFTNDSVKTAKLTGRLQGDALQLRLNATRLTGRPLVQADIHASKLDLGKLLPKEGQKTEAPASLLDWLVPTAEAEPAPAAFVFDTKGSLRADVVSHPDYTGNDLQLDWDLKSVTANLSQISGKARLRQAKGEAKNLRALMAGSKAAKILLQPLSVLQRIDTATGGALKIPSLESFPFTSLAGDYVFAGGVATLAPMTMTSPSLSSHAEGTVGLAGEQPLNLKIVVTADADQLGGVIGAGLAALGEGTQTVRMTVTGTVDNPKPSVDQQALKQKGEDLIRGLGQKFLKNLAH